MCNLRVQTPQFTVGMSRCSSTEDRVHRIRGIPLQGWDDVRVGVHGESNGRVTEHLHDDARMDSLREQQTGGVSQGVEANAGEIRWLTALEAKWVSPSRGWV